MPNIALTYPFSHSQILHYLSKILHLVSQSMISMCLLVYLLLCQPPYCELLFLVQICWSYLLSTNYDLIKWLEVQYNYFIESAWFWQCFFGLVTDFAIFWYTLQPFTTFPTSFKTFLLIHTALHMLIQIDLLPCGYWSHKFPDRCKCC